MAKSKDQKNQLVEELNQGLKDKKAVVFCDYQGLKVKEIQGLKRKLAELKISFKVIKNSLLKIALKNHQLTVDDKNWINSPIAVSFADDEVSISKEISAATKELESLEIVGAFVDKQYCEPGVIKELSLLPSRDELLGRLVGTLNAPISGLANVLSGNIRGLINVINNYRSNKSTE